MNFTDAAPIVRTRTGGRTAGPNPYTEIIDGIALQTYPKGHAYAGKPITKSFTLESATAEEAKKNVARVRRQLSDAGHDNNPPVTVRKIDETVESTKGAGKNAKTVFTSTITFWTVTLIEREIKPTAPTSDVPVTE